MAAVEQFADAVETVAPGGTVIDPDVVQRMLDRQRVSSPIDSLSPRERQILGLMAEGRSNQAIVRLLVLSPKTVESHVRSIFNKLSITEAPDDHRRVLAAVAYLQAG